MEVYIIEDVVIQDSDGDSDHFQNLMGSKLDQDKSSDF